MNIGLIILAFIYYSIITVLFIQTQNDPSASLGLGYAMLIVIVISGILLLILYLSKVIKIKTTGDKVGVFFASPIPTIIAFVFLQAQYEHKASYEFNKGGHRYRIINYLYKKTSRIKRIEVYKSVDTISNSNPFLETHEWVKDSAWIYLSQNGDTLKKEYYKDNALIK